MNKKHIISIGGEVASGKGTVAKILMEKLNYTVYKNGDYFRKLGIEMGMDVTSFNKYVEQHPDIDRKIEKSASEYAKDHEKFVLDARLGWYAVPESFKVYLVVDADIAALRAFNDSTRRDSEKFTTVEDKKKDIQERYALENKRYWELYQVKKEDLSNYDLVINTTELSPEEVANKIITEYKKWLEQ